jgi:cytochrome c-type biogenesis protein CcmH/NrfG
MMGWIALVVLAAAAFGAMIALRVPRLLWSMVGAALMLGATGYALQGSPALPASPVLPDRNSLVVDEALANLRTDIFGRYGADSAYLTAADALSRGGNPRYEVEALLGGIRTSPKSVQLWTALGDALARHDRQLSPASRFAFDRARQLEPANPGPYFFLGVAQLRSNDFPAARDSWRMALAKTPADAPYRAAIAQRLALLDRLLSIDPAK